MKTHRSMLPATLAALCCCAALLSLPAGTSYSDPPDGSMAAQAVAAHNRYRAELGIPGLTWSQTLAEHAQVWADHLASIGGRSLMHSQNSERPGEGENLWMGTSGYYSVTQMVDTWGNEKQYYRDGVFPNVSTTGSWFQVGHYTQMIWRDTREVGCARASAGGNDIFVCRYSPPGNYMGRKAY